MAQMAVEQAVFEAVRQVEVQVDAELERLEQLKDDEYETLRRNRLAEMKKEAEKRREWSANGHGTVSTIAERDFFDVVKRSDRVCAVFYRTGASRFTDDIIAHLDRVAEAHVEAKFVLLDAEKCPFLVDRLRIQVLPSIVLVKNAKADYTYVGLDELLTSKRTLETVTIEQRLFDRNFLSNTDLADSQKR
mmetsp:Transcript_2708/g.7397  ORF Transcript_2708/g.7397 Transcript_2708/m.7397 type:complete len:190 (+) Transcript_2708:66-635(+)